MVKRAARFFGGALAGVCELDERWLYSHVVNVRTQEHKRLELPEGVRYAIAIAVEMDHSLLQASPTAAASPATGLGYSKMAFISGLLARFIRGLGYRAIPSGNDTALSIPIAIEAGLGELGRHGILITEKYGPRVRLCKVFTDMPLVPDKPVFFGVEEFCRTCKKCADDCPSRAIPFGEKSTQVPTRSNNPGVLKWTIDPEQCFKYWIANHTECSNCIRVCPFNQPPGWHHDLVRAIVKRTTLFNRFLLRMDGLFGYGDQIDPQSIWDGE
jgi:reductive dehalogenase